MTGENTKKLGLSNKKSLISEKTIIKKLWKKISGTSSWVLQPILSTHLHSEWVTKKEMMKQTLLDAAL